MLAVVETHPVQYRAPVYRALQERHGIAVTVVYGSDFSLRPYRDAEFGAPVAWDVDLLGGHAQRFLSHASATSEPDLARLPAAGLDDVLRELAPAATLITGYSPRFHRAAWYAAWRLGRPVLFRAEVTDEGGDRPVARGLRDAALRVAYRSCTRLLPIGARARRHYLAHGVPADRLVFAPYCVDAVSFAHGEDARARLRPAAREAWGIGADDLVVLFVGKLSERKGVDLLVGALRRRLPDLDRRVCLMLAGDGVERDRLEAASQGVEGLRTIVAGVQAQRDLSAMYHLADLLVLPSRRGETWGLVVNEGLLHGVPVVVSTRVGCADDLVVPDTGVTCEPDEAALAAAIGRARALCGRPAVREACRRKVAAYSVEAAAAGLARAYAEAVRGTA